MNLPTIDMPRPEARRRLEEYRALLAVTRTREDELIRRGYAALARGETVFSLPEAIRAGGWDSAGRPNLAVARASARQVRLSASGADLMYVSDEGWRTQNRGALVNHWTVVVRGVPDTRTRTAFRSAAMVPPIPPRFRPKPQRLHLFHVLWEAEWTLQPPHDPALVRWLGGDLWAVMATWDLTEIERAVLAGSRRG